MHLVRVWRFSSSKFCVACIIMTQCHRASCILNSTTKTGCYCYCYSIDRFVFKNFSYFHSMLKWYSKLAMRRLLEINERQKGLLMIGNYLSVALTTQTYISLLTKLCFIYMTHFQIQKEASVNLFIFKLVF